SFIIVIQTSFKPFHDTLGMSRVFCRNVDRMQDSTNWMSRRVCSSNLFCERKTQAPMACATFEKLYWRTGIAFFLVWNVDIHMGHNAGRIERIYWGDESLYLRNVLFQCGGMETVWLSFVGHDYLPHGFANDGRVRNVALVSALYLFGIERAKEEGFGLIF